MGLLHDRLRLDEEGFTLIELLVTILLFAIVSGAFYQVVFAGSNASNVTRDVVRVSDEARLGLNRMIRDTRQADQLTLATTTGYAIVVDFNGDGSIAQAPTKNTAGDYEQLSFVVSGTNLYIEACSAVQGLDCGQDKTILVKGVSQVGSRPFFSYASNRLEYDCAPADGIATQAEVQNIACNITGLTPSQVLAALSDVVYAMEVSSGGSSSEFYTHAEVRNLR